MTSIFEFLFKYRPLLYEKGNLAFHPPWPPYATWLLGIAGIALAYLLYRRAASVLDPGWRVALAALRSLLFLILVFIFLQPVLVLPTVIPQRSFVGVAYDLSKSMEIRDGEAGQSRLEVVQQLLRPEGNPMLEELEKKFKLRFFQFSSSARRSEGFQDLARHGNVTNLERTLGQVTAELGNAPIAGIVLLTDGADNSSSDLSAAAARLRARNIPLYTVGIGKPGFSRDTEVVRVSAPKRVLKDAMVEADVSVRAAGYAGRKARLTVKLGERSLQSEEITLGSDGEVRTYKVQFSGDTAGPKIFSFRVEPFADEVISENNVQDVLVRVEDSRPKILYCEGEPRWVYKFLRRAAEEDKNLRLVTILRQAEGKIYRQGIEDPAILEKGFPVDKAELFAYQGLILGSIEASYFSFDQLRLVSDFVSQRGGGFLMLGGENSFAQGGYLNTPLEDLLPVNLRPGPRETSAPPYEDVEYRLRLTDYGFLHPVTRLMSTEEENRKRWDSAPALVGLNRTSGVKPGATVLAQASIPAGRGGEPPLLAFQRFGKGKSMALTTGSTWHWRMQLDHKDNTHELFWKQLLRWLVSDVPDPIGIQTEKHSYSLEEPVVLGAEVYDETYIHQNNARVTAVVKSPSGQMSSVPLDWDVRREGSYSAVFRAKEEGIHEVSVEATQGTKSLGMSKANFRIAESTEEYHNAALNADLLKRLAQETGGGYYSPRDLGTLAEDISYVDNGSSQIEEKDLWDMPFLFILLITVLSCEWVLRKRKGLA